MGFSFEQKLLSALCSLIFCCTFILESSPALADKVLPGYIIEVPANTIVPIKFCADLKSDFVQDGDEFCARTIEDLRVNGEIVVPSSSTISGRCLFVRPLPGLKRSKMFQLKFDTINLPDKTQFVLAARPRVRAGRIRLSRGTKEIFIPARVCLLDKLVGTVLCVFGAKAYPNKSIRARNENLYLLPKNERPLLSTENADRHTVVIYAKDKKGFQILDGDETVLELAEPLRVTAP